MKSTALYLALTLLAASPVLICQTTGGPGEPSGAFSSSSQTGDATTPPATATRKYDIAPAPFSRIGLSVGISAMGVNLQAATNVNRYINVRGTGNYFSYTVGAALSAASICDWSLPPASAISGLPPPEPPTSLATAPTSLPA
jgi:hypothetical protein